jgi:hypothetical protein
MTEKEQYKARLLRFRAIDAATEAGLARIHATLAQRAACTAEFGRNGKGSTFRTAEPRRRQQTWPSTGRREPSHSLKR